ncbi:MAG: hypothetical protein K9J30_10965 [Bacteroidales bacterium]|nr:hypothetical protein [Bacteroidales bacterium]
MKIKWIPFLFVILQNTSLFGQGNYDHFKVSVYTRAYEVQKMQDQHWLDSTWKVISSQLDIDKIYLETHRDLLIVDQKTLTKAKEFFLSKGLEVAGGITYTINERNRFETFCYSRKEHREKVREIMEYTARNFNEVILDDFFFTSCKCDKCMAAKGNQNWSEYRLDLMTKATNELILEPARKINPNVNVIIKYPNWYDHFHELGFNLETQPTLFDGLYTGTETRDAVMSNQHLQPYLGYLIFRYFHNIKPGGNGGGWVDTGGMKYFDRYAEQLWLTIFAKAPEMTLFDYRQMLYPLRKEYIPAWNHISTSYSYKDFLPLNEHHGMAKAASHSLKIIDEVAGFLGNPIGIKSYKPYHSDGEDFLQNYFGMIGIPIDIVPEFPYEEDLIILTEQSKHDENIIEKITRQLTEGKDVVITSGLLTEIQDHGLEKLVKISNTGRKSLITATKLYGKITDLEEPVLIPQLQYFTNDSWEIISGMDNGLGWPLLHMARISNGTLYVMTIPENFADLYNLPNDVLDQFRALICAPLDIDISGPSRVALFVYDNNTFVVESFNDHPVQITVHIKSPGKSVIERPDGNKVKTEIIPELKQRGQISRPEQLKITVEIPPHSFKVFTTN